MTQCFNKTWSMDTQYRNRVYKCRFIFTTVTNDCEKVRSPK